MIFAAIDNDANLLSVIVAESKQLAEAFLAGRGIIPHTLREVKADSTSPIGVREVINVQYETTSPINPKSKVKSVRFYGGG